MSFAQTDLLALRQNKEYWNKLEQITGPEALADYCVRQPLEFLQRAHEGDMRTMCLGRYEVVGVAQYQFNIFPIIAVEGECELFPGEIMDTTISDSFVDGNNAYILVGRYIWDHYMSLSSKTRQKLITALYPHVAHLIEPQFFTSSLQDAFTVAHVGYEAFQKSLFDIENLRRRYNHQKKATNCELVMKFGDRLSSAITVAQRITSKVHLIRLDDFISTLDEEEDEHDKDQTHQG